MTSASQRLACYNTDTAMATAKRQLRVGELAAAGWSITDIANSGYYAHRRRGELPCKPCTTAASQTALRNKRRRQQQQQQQHGKEGAGQ